MAYKSIFTPMTAFQGNTEPLDYAQKLASRLDAHLDILCLGLDQTHTAYYEMGSNAMVLQAALEAAQQRADEMRDAVEKHMKGAQLRYEVFSSLGSLSGLGPTIASRARFADLGVVGLPYAAGLRGDESLVLEGLLFDAECPTLVVPGGATNTRPKNIVIGWNESTEAIRAIRAALPFLQAADSVHIAIIDPPQHGPERSDPGGSLAVFLARHGVGSDIQVLSRGGTRISERLTQHVTEMDAHMLVIGAYGHSRLREAVLGGVTREMLENSKVPVFMAR